MVAINGHEDSLLNIFFVKILLIVHSKKAHPFIYLIQISPQIYALFEKHFLSKKKWGA
jgi:hypothetical protein